MLRELGNPLDLGRIVGTKQVLRMTADQRSTHLHIVGSTGSGKTKSLEHLLRQDLRANPRSKCGVLLLDPHGSLYESIMAWLASNRLQLPIVPIDLRRDNWVVAYNLLRQRDSVSASVIVDGIIDAITHVWGAANTDRTPRFPRWASNILHVLYEKGHTLPDAVHLLSTQVELRQAMTAGISDENARRDWDMASKFKPREFEDEVSSTLNRLRRFVSNPHMRAIFGQPKISFDFATALSEGQIVLVNLSQEGGLISEENARLFGTLLLNDLWTAAKERGKRDRIKPFYIYVDEFQKFLSPTIADNLDQSRGFGLHWTLSHQFPAQLRDSGENGLRVYNSVMENARSKTCFSLSTRDNLEPMAEWLFTGTMNPDEIKHELYSTKVMAYREEYRRTYTQGSTTSEGGTHHASSSSGEGSGGSTATDSESWNDFSGSAAGDTDSWSRSTTETVTETPTQVPVLGKELAGVQFRSLEEQLFRAMAVLFDQEQRQCVVRLRGMKAPVSLFTPFVDEPVIRKSRVEEYIDSIYHRLPARDCALPGTLAKAVVAAHSKDFAKNILSIAEASETDEPTTAKRRIR